MISFGKKCFSFCDMLSPCEKFHNWFVGRIGTGYLNEIAANFLFFAACESTNNLICVCGVNLYLSITMRNIVYKSNKVVKKKRFFFHQANIIKLCRCTFVWILMKLNETGKGTEKETETEKETVIKARVLMKMNSSLIQTLAACDENVHITNEYCYAYTFRLRSVAVSKCR